MKKEPSYFLLVRDALGQLAYLTATGRFSTMAGIAVRFPERAQAEEFLQGLGYTSKAPADLALGTDRKLGFVVEVG